MTVCIAVATVLSASACAPSEEPEPEQLTITQAGAKYLGAVCPVNRAWDAVDIEVDRLRIAVARDAVARDADDSSVDTRLFADAMSAVQSASTRAEARLGDETVSWPTAAQSAISEVRESLRADASQAETVADLPADAVAEFAWQGADRLAEAASDAREALGLPEDPIAACEARNSDG